MVAVYEECAWAGPSGGGGGAERPSWGFGQAGPSFLLSVVYISG